MPERTVFAHLVSVFGEDLRGFDSAARVLRLIVGALVVEKIYGEWPTNDRLQEVMTFRGWWSMATFYRDLRVFKRAFPGEKPAEVAQRFRPYVEIVMKKNDENLLNVMDLPWELVRKRRGSS
ncbi:MAG: hypothetical protein ACLP81_01470 [Acidimicrobiales bacterium]